MYMSVARVMRRVVRRVVWRLQLTILQKLYVHRVRFAINRDLKLQRAASFPCL